MFCVTMKGLSGEFTSFDISKKLSNDSGLTLENPLMCILLFIAYIEIYQACIQMNDEIFEKLMK